MKRVKRVEKGGSASFSLSRKVLVFSFKGSKGIEYYSLYMAVY